MLKINVKIKILLSIILILFIIFSSVFKYFYEKYKINTDIYIEHNIEIGENIFYNSCNDITNHVSSQVTSELYFYSFNNIVNIFENILKLKETIYNIKIIINDKYIYDNISKLIFVLPKDKQQYFIYDKYTKYENVEFVSDTKYVVNRIIYDIDKDNNGVEIKKEWGILCIAFDKNIITSNKKNMMNIINKNDEFYDKNIFLFILFFIIVSIILILIVYHIIDPFYKIIRLINNIDSFDELTNIRNSFDIEFRDTIENIYNIYLKLKKHNILLENEVERRTNKINLINKELDIFIKTISHDLLNPIRNLLLAINIIIEENEDNKVIAKWSNHIKSNKDIIERISKNLIRYIKVSNNTIDNYSYVNIDNDIIKSIIDSINPSIDINIDIKCNITLYCDRFHIHTLFLNLINNAIKCNSNNITIICDYYNTNCLFAIIDNGCGGLNDDKFLSSINNINISGVGLVICKKIIELYNGEFWYESEENKGCAIFFTLENHDALAYENKK